MMDIGTVYLITHPPMLHLPNAVSFFNIGNSNKNRLDEK